MTKTIEIAPSEDISAVQAGVNAMAAQGGGRVSLLPGRHVCGPIVLADNIELHLAEGAVLAPVPEHDLYLSNISRVLPEMTGTCMIYASGAANVAITGTGTIHGGGNQFIAGDDVAAGVFIPKEPRPRTIILEACRNVTIGPVTLEESAMWTLHLIHCEDVLVDGYRVLNDMRMPNTDGLVLDACSRVTVRDAVIRTADDGIVLKSSKSVPQRHCADITIENCVIESGSCAIKIGTETHGDFDRISVANCKLEGCNRALGILSRDGGHVRDVTFRTVDVDCHETPFGFWGSGEAVTITQLNRRSTVPAGKVSGIMVENLTGVMEGAVNFYAAEPGGIEGVTLRSVRLRQRPGALGTGRQQDIRPTEADIAPSKDAAGRVGAWVRGDDGKIVGLIDYPGGMPGLFSHNVDGLVIEDVVIERPNPLPAGWNEEPVVIE